MSNKRDYNRNRSSSRTYNIEEPLIGRGWDNSKEGLLAEKKRQESLLEISAQPKKDKYERRWERWQGAADPTPDEDPEFTIKEPGWFEGNLKEIDKRLLWHERGVVTKEELDDYDKNFADDPTTPGWKGRTKEAGVEDWQKDIQNEVREEYATKRIARQKAQADASAKARARRKTLLGLVEEETL